MGSRGSIYLGKVAKVSQIWSLESQHPVTLQASIMQKLTERLVAMERKKPCLMFPGSTLSQHLLLSSCPAQEGMHAYHNFYSIPLKKDAKKIPHYLRIEDNKRLFI